MASTPPVSEQQFKIKYLIDGIDLSSLGIYVSQGSGYLDGHKRKIAYRHEWLDEDGADVDLTSFSREARDFRFDCFVIGNTIDDAIEKLNGLLAITDQPGVRTLDIEYYGPTEKLTLKCYREEPVKVVKRFRYLKNVWTFTMTLKEHFDNGNNNGEPNNPETPN